MQDERAVYSTLKISSTTQNVQPRLKGTREKSSDRGLGGAGSRRHQSTCSLRTPSSNRKTRSSSRSSVSFSAPVSYVCKAQVQAFYSSYVVPRVHRLLQYYGSPRHDSCTDPLLHCYHQPTADFLASPLPGSASLSPVPASHPPQR